MLCWWGGARRSGGTTTNLSITVKLRGPLPLLTSTVTPNNRTLPTVLTQPPIPQSVTIDAFLTPEFSWRTCQLLSPSIVSVEALRADMQPSAAEDSAHDTPTPNGSPATSKHLRMRTNTAEIDSTITHPGSVKINVQGAFIVDQDPESPNGKAVNGGSHDTKDIRLPNHTAVVSHIAVDVCFSAGLWSLDVVHPSRDQQKSSPVTDWAGRLEAL